MTSIIYNSALEGLAKDTMDFVRDRFLVTLVHSDYIPDKNHRVVGEVFPLLGFPKTVNVAVNSDLKRNRMEIELGEAEWPGITVSAVGAVYYDETGQLVAFIDFGRNVSATNGLFSLTASTLRLQN